MRVEGNEKGSATMSGVSEAKDHRKPIPAAPAEANDLETRQPHLSIADRRLR